MNIDVERAGSITIVNTSKRIDSDNANEYERILENLLTEGTHNLLLDFTHTEYVGSAGLRAFLIIAKKLKKTNGNMALCQINPHVFEIFKVGGFHQIFRIYPTREEGMLFLLSPNE